MPFAEIKTIVEFILQVVALIGIPITIWRYFANEAKRRQLETDALHVEVNNKYLDFLGMASAHPNLGVSDGPEHRALVSLKSDEDKVRQWFLFSYLTSILERAFYLTRWSSGHHRDVEEEWASWERYIADYFLNQNFRRYWEEVTANFTKQTSFGPAFENYMRRQYDPKTPKLP